MPRPRLSAPALAAVVAAALLAGYAVLWLSVSRGNIATSDFTGAYIGGLSLREGHRADLYDEARQAPIHAALVAPARTTDFPYVYPPAAAVVMAPFSLLSLDAAYRLFEALQLACLVTAVIVAARAAPWSAAARRARAPLLAVVVGLAGAGTLALGLLGQWDGLGALGVAIAYACWRRDARFTGGLVLAASAGLAKPHLAIGLAAFLLGWRDRRVLAGAASALVVIALVSVIAVGPAGVGGFVSTVRTDSGRWPSTIMLGFSGLTGSWLGDGAPAHLLALLGSAAAVVVCLVVGGRLRSGSMLEPCLAGALLLSLLASPHLLTHDLVLLAPLFVALLGWASRRRPAAAWPGPSVMIVLVGWAVLSVTAFVDLASQHPAPPGRLVPVVLAAAAGSVLWASRSSPQRRFPGALTA